VVLEAEAEGAAGGAEDCAGGADDGTDGAEGEDCCAQTVETKNTVAHRIVRRRRRRIMFDLRGRIEACSSASGQSFHR
jgi:hypothetical protein